MVCVSDFPSWDQSRHGWCKAPNYSDPLGPEEMASTFASTSVRFCWRAMSKPFATPLKLRWNLLNPCWMRLNVFKLCFNICSTFLLLLWMLNEVEAVCLPLSTLLHICVHTKQFLKPWLQFNCVVVWQQQMLMIIMLKMFATPSIQHCPTSKCWSRFLRLLDMKLYSILSLFTQVYQWGLVTYCWR